jgi:hypothetical protein
MAPRQPELPPIVPQPAWVSERIAWEEKRLITIAFAVEDQDEEQYNIYDKQVFDTDSDVSDRESNTDDTDSAEVISISGVDCCLKSKK